MISVPKLDAYFLNAFEHQHGDGGAPSLDVIVQEHYGREYNVQQTGEKLSNGSWTHYLMDEEMVQQYLFDGITVIKGEHHWLPHTYLMGREGIEHWLAMDRSDDFSAKLAAVRQAPTPEIILADLIDKGLLPHGAYILHCWW